MEQWINWILLLFAIGTVVFNTVVVHVTLKNDVCHLKKEQAEIKSDMKKLLWHLIDKGE